MQIRKTNPVIYFDSTGSIIRKIDYQKQMYLYSLVAYDTTNSVIIPIAEFYTTCHTVLSISNYLFQIKQIFDHGVEDKYNVFPIVVMDQSFPLIISILKIFNGCNLIDYINWSYYVLVENNSRINDEMKTRVSFIFPLFINHKVNFASYY
jgi:hypothetical protein